MTASRLVLMVILMLGLLAAPLAAEAQQAGKVVRIGYLSPAEPPTPAAPSGSLEAFKEGLRALGYVEGRHYTVETRFADTKLDRLPGLARELVDLNVDVIMTIGTPTVKAAKDATATIPIVMAGSADPVEHGLVASLARPGGNVTGVTHSPGRRSRPRGSSFSRKLRLRSHGWPSCGTRAASTRGAPLSSSAPPHESWD